jgi:hypothetical protein
VKLPIGAVKLLGGALSTGFAGSYRPYGTKDLPRGVANGSTRNPGFLQVPMRVRGIRRNSGKPTRYLHDPRNAEGVPLTKELRPRNFVSAVMFWE